MKRIIVIAVSTVTSLLLICLLIYRTLPQLLAITWAITSIVDVPICTARAADKLGIQHDFFAVKDYIIQSLEPGMTPEEVENTLRRVAPIEVGQTFTDEEHAIHSQVLVRLCNNPLGNMLLFLYYSKDGHLINAADTYED